MLEELGEEEAVGLLKDGVEAGGAWDESFSGDKFAADAVSTAPCSQGSAGKPSLVRRGDDGIRGFLHLRLAVQKRSALLYT